MSGGAMWHSDSGFGWEIKKELGEESVHEIMQICENNLQKLFFTEEKKK